MKKILLRLFIVLLLSIPIILYWDHFPQLEVFPGRDAMKKTQQITNDDPYLNKLGDKLTDLELNEIFWRRRINTKIPDDFTLIISLRDSSVWLDIDGISVHESKISSIQLSLDLRKKRESADVKTWLKKSFYLSEQWATIPKEPIRTKDLSGDRNGLDSLDLKPSLIDSTDIMIIFQYSDNLKIGLKQTRLNSGSKVLLEKQGNKNDISENLISPTGIHMSYSNLLEGDWISIELPALEVIAIYRALKLRSQLVLGL